MEKDIQRPKTISVRMVESYSTYLVKESVEISVDDYPELNGMNEEEMKNYISENWHDMKPVNQEYYESLFEECSDSDIIRDKITNEEFECKFD